MKFIYLGGQYTQVMGRMFAFKKATDVPDKATQAVLLKRSDFMRVDDEQKEKPQEQPQPAPRILRPTLGVRRK